MLALVTAVALLATPVDPAPSAKSRAERPGVLLRSWAQLGGGVAAVTVGALAGFGAGCVLDSLSPRRSFTFIGPGCSDTALLFGLSLGIAAAPIGLWLGSEALGMNSRLEATIGGFILGGLLIVPGVVAINALNAARYDYRSYYQPSSVPVDFFVTLIATVMCTAPFAGGILGSELSANWEGAKVRPTAALSPRGGSFGFALSF